MENIQIGSVRIQALLDLSAIPNQIQSLSNDSRVKQGIKISVDTKELHDLNKLYDIKQKHHKETAEYVKRNPISPSVNLEELHRLNRELDSISRSRSTSVKVDLNVDDSQLQQISRKIIIESEVRLKPQKSIALPDITAPFKSIGNGILQGLGIEAASGISKSIRAGLESSIGQSFGSSKLVGEKIGEIISRAISEKVGKGLGKEIKDQIAELVGQDNIDAEYGARVAKKRKQQQQDRKAAAEVFNTDRQENVRARIETKEELTTVKGKAQRAAGYSQQVARSQEVATGKLFEAQLNGDAKAIYKAKKTLERSNILLADLGVYEAELGIKIADIDARAAKLSQKTKELDKKVDAMSPKGDIGLQQIANRVAGRKVNPQQLPKVIVAPSTLGANGSKAEYYAKANALVVSQDIANRLKSGQLDESSIMTGVHEVQHAADFEFGSIEGIRAQQQKKLLTQKKYTSEQVRYAAPQVARYDPSVRDIELSAIAAEYSIGLPMIKELQGKQRLDSLNKNTGYAGTNLANLGAGKIGGVKKDLGVLVGIADPKVISDLTAEAVKAKKQLGNIDEIIKSSVASNSAPEGIEAVIDKQLRSIAALEQKIKVAKKGDQSTSVKAEVDQEPLIDRARAKLDQVGQTLQKAGTFLRPIGSVVSNAYQFAQGVEKAVLPMVPFGKQAKAIGQGVGLPMLAYGGLGMLPGGNIAQAALGAGAKGLMSLPAGGMQGAVSALAGSSFGEIPMIGPAISTAISTFAGGAINAGVGAMVPVLAGKAITLIAGGAMKKALPTSKDYAQIGEKVANKTIQGSQEVAKQASAIAGKLVTVEIEKIGIEGSQSTTQIRGTSEVGGLIQVTKDIANGFKERSAKLRAAIKKGDAIQIKAISAEIIQESDKFLAGIEQIKLDDKGGRSKEAGSLLSIQGQIGKQKKQAERALKTVDQVPEPVDEDLIGLQQKDPNKRLVNNVDKKVKNLDEVINAVDNVTAKRLQDKFDKTSDSVKSLVDDYGKGGNADKPGVISKVVSGVGIGALATAIAVGAFTIATQIIPEAIKKSLANANIMMALNSISASPIDMQKTVNASKSLAGSLGLSQMSSLENLTSFKAATDNTALEGFSDDIGIGLQKFGRSRGVSDQRMKLAQTAISQMAGKGQLYSEEVFGQLAESLPGGAVELAASSGMTVKQLRAMLKKGGGNSADFLTNFGGRMNAIGNSEAANIENNPNTKLGRFSNSIEQAQIKIGDASVPKIAAAADALSKVLDLVVANIGLLGSLSAAMFIKMGIDLVAATIGWGRLGAMIAAAGQQTISLSGLMGGLKSVMASPLGEMAVVTTAIVLMGDAMGGVWDTFTGSAAPSKSIIDSMNATADSIERVTNKLLGLDSTLSGAKLSEKLEKLYAPKKNLLDQVQDRIQDINPFSAIAGQLGMDNTYLTTKKRQADDLINIGKDTLPRAEETLRKAQINNRVIDINRLAKVSEELKALRLQEGLLDGTDPAAISRNTEQQKKLGEEQKSLQEPLFASQVGIEKQIKDIEALKLQYEGIPGMDKVLKPFIDMLPKLKDELNKTTAGLSKSTSEATKTALVIESMNNRFASTNILIQRSTTAANIEILKQFGGSLNTGLQANRQYEADKQSIANRVANEKQRSQEIDKLLLAPAVQNDVKTLQKAGKLPQDLRDTNDAQLSLIEKDKNINANTTAAIKARRDSAQAGQQADLESIKQEADRQKAIKEEVKASNEYYVNSIASIHQTQLASAEASRELLTKSYTSQFKTAMTGVNSAVGLYMNGLIDQFTALGELTKIETDRQKAKYDLDKQEYDTKINLLNRQNANTIDPVATIQPPTPSIPGSVMSPIPGVNMADIANYDPGRNGRFGANRKAGAHKGIDFKAPAGTPVMAAFDGTVTMQKNVPFYGGSRVSQSKLILEGVDAEGKQIRAAYFHLGKKSWDYFKEGQKIQVKAGQVIGDVGKDGDFGLAASVGEHLHFELRRQGKIVDPRKALAQEYAARSKGSTNAMSTMPKGSALTPEVWAKANKYNAMAPSNGDTTPILGASIPITSSVYFPGEDHRTGNRKMQGEKVDMKSKYIDRNSLVMATRTTDSIDGLPYGSTVEVTNPKNNKKVVVKVIDRGSLRPGVDTDLTPASMARLGLEADGRHQLQMRVISTPKPISKINLGSGIGKYDKKGTYIGPRGQTYSLGDLPPDLAKTAVNDPLPTPQASPGANDLGAYNAAIGNIDKQRELNKEYFAQQSKTAEINIALNSINTSMATQVALRKEAEDNIIKKQQAIQAEDQVGDMTPERQRKITVRDANFKRGDIQRKIAEDLEQIEDEDVKLTLQMGVFTNARTPQLKAANPRQYKVLGNMIEYAEAARKNIRARISQVVDLGKKAEKLANSSEDFNDVKNARLVDRDLFSINVNQRQRNEQRLGGELAAARTFTEANPFNFSKGDPLKIQANIETEALKRSTLEEIKALEEKALTASIPMKKDIAIAIDFAKKQYLEKYEQIKTNLALAIKKRSSDEAAYIMASQSARIESSLSASSAQSQLYAAQGSTGIAKQREYSDGFQKRELENAQEITRLNKILSDDPSKKNDVEQMRKDLDARYLLGQRTAATTYQRERELKLAGLGESLEGSRVESTRSQSGLLKARGNNYDARTLDKEAAYRSEALAISKQMREFDIQLKAEIPNSGEYKAIEKLREEAQKLSEVKLTTIGEEFSRFRGLIDGTSTALGKMWDDGIRGKGIDLLDAPRAFLEGILGPIGDYTKSAIASMSKGLLGGLVGDLNGLISKPGAAQTGAEQFGVDRFLSSFSTASPLPVQVVGSDITSPLLPIPAFDENDPFGADQAVRSLENGAINAAQSLIFGGKGAGNFVSDSVGLLGDLLNGGNQRTSSSGGNLFGSLLGGLGKILGFADGGLVDFSSGGFTGSGGKYAEKGIVHAGEYVFTKEATKAMGVGNLETLHRSLKGYADGGLVGSILNTPSLSVPNFNIPSTKSSISMPAQKDPQPLRLEYKEVAGIQVVEKSHLDERLAEQDRSYRNALQESQRQQNDRMMHSVAYRSQMGF